eukprot:30721-Pyramimonas_sp.AAC.1
MAGRQSTPGRDEKRRAEHIAIGDQGSRRGRREAARDTQGAGGLADARILAGSVLPEPRVAPLILRTTVLLHVAVGELALYEQIGERIGVIEAHKTHNALGHDDPLRVLPPRIHHQRVLIVEGVREDQVPGVESRGVTRLSSGITIVIKC